MIQKELTILNRLGLHARPAAQIVQTAAGFNCDIELTKDGVTINAKSIMGVMALASQNVENIDVYVDGEDEEEALKAIAGLLE